MPFKVFTSTTHTAAEVNDYLMEQANIVVTSGTRPTGQEGMHIVETDTDRKYVHDGTDWRTDGGLAWKTFTPSWTNVTVGNGTQEARYRYVPGGMWMYGSLTFGSTTNVTGNVQLTVANSETAALSGHQVGTARYFDTGTRNYVGICRLSSTTVIAFDHTESGNSGIVNASNPIAAWATGDVIAFQCFIPLT